MGVFIAELESPTTEESSSPQETDPEAHGTSAADQWVNRVLSPIPALNALSKSLSVYQITTQRSLWWQVCMTPPPTETSLEKADLNTKAQMGCTQYPHRVSAIVDFAACTHLPKRDKLGPSAKLLHFRNLHRDNVGLG